MSPTPTLPTLPDDWQRALVVAAHPDDIEYGLAAAVAKWTGEGRTVTYLLVTRGEAGIDTMDPAEAAAVRAQEERDGAAEVGVDVVEFLDHTDGIVEYGLDLRRDIARIIRARRPEVLFASTHRERFAGGATNQADHRAVGLAAMDAARDAGNRWVFPELNADDEPWGGTRFIAYVAAPDPTHAYDVSDHLEPAVASLEAHSRYLEALGADYPGPRDLLTGILTAGGELTGTRYGLGFEVFEL